METISRSIRNLEAKLVPQIHFQEDRDIRAEIAVLKEERKKLEALATERRAGVSLYGSYFMTNQ